VRLIVDTGSSDLWLKSSSQAAPFGVGRVYDHKSSHSSQASPSQRVTINYGQGRVDGSEVQDHFCLENLCIEHQSFIFADYVFGIPGQWLFDGVMGLGYAPLALNKFGPTLVQSLGMLFQNLAIGFAVAKSTTGGGSYLAIGELEDLTRDAAAAGLGRGITMRLLGINHQAMYWLVPTKIEVASRAPPGSRRPMTTTAQTDSAMAILDSGTTLITAPGMAYLELIGAMLEGKPEAVQKCTTTLMGSFGQLMCLCDVDINPVMFTLTGTDGRQLQVSLAAQDLMQLVGVGALGPGVCRINVMPSPPGMPLWILGDVFLRHVYAVHDVPHHMLHLFPQKGSRVAAILEADQQDSSRVLSGTGIVTLTITGATCVVAAAAFMCTVRKLRTERASEGYNLF